MVSVVLKATLLLVLACVVLMEGSRVVGDMLPQAEEIAFAGYEQVENPGAVNIYRYDISRRLSANVTGEAQGHYFHPVWSPDGSQLAFVSVAAPTYELYIVNADGSDLQQLVSYEGSIAYPQWSADGTRLAFLAETESGYTTNVLNLTSGSARQFSNVRAMARAHNGSANGQSIFLTSQSSFKQIDNIDIGDAESSNDGFPSYPPNILHSEIAYAALSTRSHVFNLNSADMQQNTTNPAAFDLNTLAEPFWARYGSGSGFIVQNGNDAPRLYAANGNGMNLSTFPTILGQSSLYPQWTSDGSALLYIDAYSSAGSSYSVNVDTGSDEQLALNQVISKAFAIRP